MNNISNQKGRVLSQTEKRFETTTRTGDGSFDKLRSFSGIVIKYRLECFMYFLNRNLTKGENGEIKSYTFMLKKISKHCYCDDFNAF